MSRASLRRNGPRSGLSREDSSMWVLSGVLFVGLERETEGDGDGVRLEPPPFSVIAKRIRNGVALGGVLSETRPGIG